MTVNYALVYIDKKGFQSLGAFCVFIEMRILTYREQSPPAPYPHLHPPNKIKTKTARTVLRTRVGWGGKTRSCFFPTRL